MIQSPPLIVTNGLLVDQREFWFDTSMVLADPI